MQLVLPGLEIAMGIGLRDGKNGVFCHQTWLFEATQLTQLEALAGEESSGSSHLGLISRLKNPLNTNPQDIQQSFMSVNTRWIYQYNFR